MLKIEVDETAIVERELKRAYLEKTIEAVEQKGNIIIEEGNNLKLHANDEFQRNNRQYQRFLDLISSLADEKFQSWLTKHSMEKEEKG